MRAQTRWGVVAVLLCLLVLGGKAYGVPLPSGDDTMDNMAVKGPVIQSVPNTSTLLVMVMWTRDRTKDSVLTIQELKSRKFIAEIRRPYNEANPDAEAAAEIWVDKCFADSGSACGGPGIRFAGTPGALQDMIVQRIQKYDSELHALTDPKVLPSQPGPAGG
jgi:hypothetical protein